MMMRVPKAICLLILFCLALLAAAQPPQPVKWSAALDPTDTRAGESARILLTAQMSSEWHIYSLKKTTDVQATIIELVSNPGITPNGAVIEPTPTRKLDPNAGIDVEEHIGNTTFAIPVQIAASSKGIFEIKVKVTFQPCTDKNCLLSTTVEVPVNVRVAAGEPRPDRMAALTVPPNQPTGHIAPQKTPAPGSSSTGPAKDRVAEDLEVVKKKGALAYMWFAFTFGLLALLTPCVFPMIPVTVSYFTKQVADSRAKSLKMAGAYCVGIISTFTLLGMVMTLLFGATGIQKLATNPYVNLGVGLLFVFLAISLFGVFELVLPSGLANKANMAGRNSNSLLGPVLMGLTFSLTTFTCTVPFVGTLLASAAGGEVTYPILGMLAFSTALCIPFFFLALFPQYLAKLPKSGSWLATVKGYLGFLELVAALKFLSNADLYWMLGWLPRPVFLAIWVFLFTLAGLYLLGWIKLGHETSEPRIGPLRRGMALLTLAASIWMLAGLAGRNLGGNFSAFLPPDPYPGQEAMSKSHDNIAWIYSYREALVKAKAENKPLFLNFTGYQCTNCRWMEAEMFPRADVGRELENYVPVWLYTDGKEIEDAENQKLQLGLANTTALPYYIVLTPDGKVLDTYPGLERDPDVFVDFLKSARAGKKVALGN